MQELLNQLEIQYSKHLPFVVYRKPNTLEIKAILQNDDTVYITDNFEEEGFVFSPFDDRDDTIIIPLAASSQVSNSYSDIAIDTEASILGDVLDTDKAFHINLVDKGISEIKKGNLQKVVLSRKEEITYSGTDIFSIFKNLVVSYSSAFAYCWYHPKVGLWLGATPETLLKIEGRHFSIMALAGTQDYLGTLNVEWQDKELQEQQYVTDFILDSIAPTVADVKVSGVETVKAGNLLHLRTLIKGNINLQALNFKTLLHNLHPTPAVCGLPKDKAKAFILKHENYDRAFYTGFLGELNFNIKAKPRTGHRNIENRAYAMAKKSTQLYVNLRCMQIKDSTALLYVGGGITAISHPESEWAETVSKSQVVKKVL